jgi:hypothetical protein
MKLVVKQATHKEVGSVKLPNGHNLQTESEFLQKLLSILSSL